MKYLIVAVLFLSACVYHPEFWQQEPRPTQRSIAAFYDNFEEVTHSTEDPEGPNVPDGQVNQSDMGFGNTEPSPGQDQFDGGMPQGQQGNR